MKEITEEELSKSAKIIGAIAFAIGVLFMMFANGATADVGLYVHLLGLGFMVLGGVVFIKGVDYGQFYLEQQRQKLAKDNKGIIWVWVVAITAWAIMAVAYFSLSMVVYMVLDQVEGFYTFSEQELGVITLTKNVTGWFLIIMTIGILGWALINSARRETSTYPI